MSEQEQPYTRQKSCVRILKLALMALIIGLICVLFMESMPKDTIRQMGGFLMPKETINLNVMSPSEVLFTAIDGFD